MLKTVTFTLMHFCIAFSVTYALTGSIAIECYCNATILLK